MDPFTQGMLGAVAAQAVAGHRLGWRALPIGLLSGMAADADIFLRPFADPALPNELHRHFTHALAFIPIGGLIVALPFLLIPTCRRLWQWTLLASIVGYATHGLLDSCTAYGTKLLWPFSSAYIAWDNVSIIDPLFTVPLTICVIAAMIWRKRMPVIAMVTLIFCLSYLGWGRWQQQRAISVQVALAETRGHTIERGRAMPTLGNLLVWRSVYVSDGMLYTDAIRLPAFGEPTVRTGKTIAVFGPDDLPTDPAIAARVADVFSRFSAFADGYMAEVPGKPGVIADMRYSVDPAGLDALWGLRLDPANPVDPVRSVGLMNRRDENLTITAWRNFYLAYTGPPDMIPLAEITLPVH